jgi:Phosphomannomutase
VNPGIGKDEFVADMKRKAPEKIAGIKVRQVKDYDGVEFVLEDDSWLLLRPSGTEPIIRVYSESDDMEKTRKIIAWGKKAVSEM